MNLPEQAKELNEVLGDTTDFLSENGAFSFFPKKGILSQAADAKKAAKEHSGINATIGVALEDDGSLMCLLDTNLNLSKSEMVAYAPSFGVKELRETWKKMIQKKNPSLNGKISLPIVTSGLTHALTVGTRLFVNEKETLLVPSLFWGNYKKIFGEWNHLTLKPYALFDGEGLNLSSLKKEIESLEHVYVLLNFPNNPTGYTPTEEEMKSLVAILVNSAEQGKKVTVFCDDAYFGLVYEERVCKESAFSYLHNAHENLMAVKIDGATKEDYAWGLRVGFLTFGNKKFTPKMYTALEDKTAGLVRGSLSNVPRISQSILLKLYNSSDYSQRKEQKAKILKERFEVTKNLIKDEKYQEVFTSLPFNSGYFMCIQLAEGINAESVRQKLLKEGHGVISLPENRIRVCFAAVSKDHLAILFDRLYDACISERAKSL